jgi:hypothetical protein
MFLFVIFLDLGNEQDHLTMFFFVFRAYEFLGVQAHLSIPQQATPPSHIAPGPIPDTLPAPYKGLLTKGIPTPIYTNRVDGFIFEDA